MRRLFALAVAAIAVSMLATACGGGDTQTAAEPGATSQSASTTAGASFDQTFIDAMVPHHQQAIEMAQAAKDAGLNQLELVEIADAIIATQQAEIDQMLEWREEWFGFGEVDPNGAEALGMSMEDMGMAGDMAALSTSDDVNATFAAMMMDHHDGAISMAEMALDEASRPEIVELAEQIIEAQQREIEIMMPHASGMDHGDMEMEEDALP